MGRTFERCGKDVVDLIARVMKKSHSDLHGAGVTIDAMFVSAETKRDGSVPALKVRGFEIAAQIKITSLADRTLGIADAKLTIDHLAWTRLNGASQTALVDHELMHLARHVKQPKKGPAISTDDMGRPLLKLRPHDWELTGFQAVVERHGEASLEVRAIKKFSADFAQLALFPVGGAS